MIEARDLADKALNKAFESGWRACQMEELPYDVICIAEQLAMEHLGWA